MAGSSKIQVVEYNIGAVGNEVEVFGRLNEVKVANRTAMKANRAEQNWSQDQVILCVQVVPHLPVAVKGAASVHIYVGASTESVNSVPSAEDECHTLAGRTWWRFEKSGRRRLLANMWCHS